MPAIVKCLRAGELCEVDYQADSLRTAAKFESPHGVYTVSNTYRATKTLLFGAHLDRLEDSALRIGMKLSLDRKGLRQALRQMIVESGYGDVRFRVSAPADTPESLILTIEPYWPPAADLIGAGARCITSATIARKNPAAKSSAWMHEREALQTAMPAGIYETFLIDAGGRIREGLTSNFYAIKKSRLLTAAEGVLAGISRTIVIQVCANVIELRFEAPVVTEIPEFDEAFLSSSSRGIVPVVEIDGMPIGYGTVGAKTKALRLAYETWVADRLEEL